MKIPEFKVQLIDPKTGLEVPMNDNIRFAWNKQGRLRAFLYVYNSNDDNELIIKPYGIK